MDDAVAFANAMTKIRYDAKHKEISLDNGDKAFLLLHRGYKVPRAHQKLRPQRVGPFPVFRRVGNLAYELKLPSNMLIHPLICSQLEPAPKDADPYNRSSNLHPPPVENISDDSDLEGDNPPYEIDRTSSGQTGHAHRTNQCVIFTIGPPRTTSHMAAHHRQISRYLPHLENTLQYSSPAGVRAFRPLPRSFSHTVWL